MGRVESALLGRLVHGGLEQDWQRQQATGGGALPHWGFDGQQKRLGKRNSTLDSRAHNIKLSCDSLKM